MDNINIIKNLLIHNKRPNLTQYFYQQNYKTNIYYFNYYHKKLKKNFWIFYYEPLIMTNNNYEILKDIKFIIPKNYYWVDTIKLTGHKIINIAWNSSLDNNNYGLGFLTDDINKLENYKGAYINIKNAIVIIKFMENQETFYPLIGGIKSIIDGSNVMGDKIYIDHKYQDKSIIIYYKD